MALHFAQDSRLPTQGLGGTGRYGQVGQSTACSVGANGAATGAIATAKTPEALRLPGFDSHPLKGVPQRYSVHVNGPWCLTFGWDGENAVDVDLENHH